MKSFLYAYKTSDGVRHEEYLDAPSKEVVFQTLRGRGIRAIKVVDKSTLPDALAHRKRIRLCVAAVVAVVLAFAVCLAYRRYGPQEDSENYTLLFEKANEIRVRFDEAILSAGSDQGRIWAAVEDARYEAMELFKGVATILPEREQPSAKQLYGDFMMHLDDMLMQSVDE